VVITMSDTDRREAVNTLVDKLAAELADWSRMVEDRAVEAGYQDGLNDALAELRAYREALPDAEYDQAYLDGLNDAICTLQTAGALDTAEPAAAADGTGADQHLAEATAADVAAADVAAADVAAADDGDGW
jgi:hypothetical protein